MEYRTYKLTVLQKRNLDNELSHLINLISKGTDCTEILNNPIKGPDKLNIEKRGVRKWMDGLIKMKNTNDCHREFIDRITSDSFFNVRLKRI